MFLTSQGHPYAIFRSALERRLLPAAWAAAHDVGSITLADSLELALLVGEQEPDRYPRVALRWHARYCKEQPHVTMAQAQAVLALLALADPASAAALRDLVRR
jgi:hypothetical protein